MYTTSTFQSNLSNNISKKSGEFSSFTLYLSSEGFTGGGVVKYDKPVEVSNTDELYEVVSKQHTPVLYSNFTRSGVNYLNQNVLVIDIDNKEYDKEEDYITIDKFLQKLEGYEVIVFGSKSHLKHKVDHDGSIQKQSKEGYSPRPRFHGYIPLRKEIDSDYLERIGLVLKDYFWCEKINKQVIDIATLNKNQQLFSIRTDRDTFNKYLRYQSGKSIDNLVDNYQFKKKFNTKNPNKKLQKKLRENQVQTGIFHLDILNKLGIIDSSNISSDNTVSITKTTSEGRRSYFLSLDNNRVWKNEGSFDTSFLLEDFIENEYGIDILNEYKKLLSQKILSNRVTLEEGRKLVRKSVNSFFEGEGNLGLFVTEGSGKSYETQVELVEYLKKNPEESVLIFCYSKKLLREWEHNLLGLGVNPNDLLPIIGRSYEEDENGNPIGSCLDPNINKLQKESDKFGTSLTGVCNRCPYNMDCNYYKTWDKVSSGSKQGKVLLFAHKYLSILDHPNLVPFRDNVKKVIVDENFVMNLSKDDTYYPPIRLEKFIDYIEDKYSIKFPSIRKITDIKTEKEFKNVLSNFSIDEIDEIRKLRNGLSSSVVNEEYYEDGIYEKLGNLRTHKTFVNFLLQRIKNPDFRSIRFTQYKDEFGIVQGVCFRLHISDTLDEFIKGKDKLFLDSNHRDYKVKILEDVIWNEKVEPVSIDILCNQDVTLIPKNMSKKFLRGDIIKGCEILSSTIRGNVKKGNRILVLTNKEFVPKFQKYFKDKTKIENEIRFENFGNLRGRNDLQEFATTIVFGHLMTNAEAGYETLFSLYNNYYNQGKIWFGDRSKEETLSIIDNQDETLSYTFPFTSIYTKEGQITRVPQVSTSNRYANEIIHTILRDEITQGVLRNRSIRSKEKKQVIIFSNEVSNLDIDRTIPFENLISNDNKINKFHPDKKLNHILENLDWNRDILVLDRLYLEKRYGHSYSEQFVNKNGVPERLFASEPSFNYWINKVDSVRVFFEKFVELVGSEDLSEIRNTPLKVILKNLEDKVEGEDIVVFKDPVEKFEEKTGYGYKTEYVKRGRNRPKRITVISKLDTHKTVDKLNSIYNPIAEKLTEEKRKSGDPLEDLSTQVGFDIIDSSNSDIDLILDLIGDYYLDLEYFDNKSEYSIYEYLESIKRLDKL